MSDALKRYLELEAKLFAWRAEHPHDTPEEDVLLDEMDEAWEELNEDEIRWIRARPHSDRGKGPQTLGPDHK
jgi:hypothetical protein